MYESNILSTAHECSSTDEPRSAVVQCSARSSGACLDQSIFGEQEGRAYCVLHFPGDDKKEAFEGAVKKKIGARDFNFRSAWFPRGFRFGGKEFPEPADFRSAFFSGSAYFAGARFASDVYFEQASFNEDSSFEGANFSKKVNFVKATFHQNANFRSTRFEGLADFRDCVFFQEAQFDRAAFLTIGSFWPATFDSTASFYEAYFKKANFRVSQFKDQAIFSWCVFGSAEFVDTSFHGTADFFKADFEDAAFFTSAVFDKAANFYMATFNAEARFTSAAFDGEADFSYAVFASRVIFSAEHDRGGFGDGASCDFRHTQFEKPNLVSFHSVTLRPNWFLNVDCWEIEFVDVRWVGDLRREFIDQAVQELVDRNENEENKGAQRRAERRRNAEMFDDRKALIDLDNEDAEAVSRTADPVRIRNKFLRLLSITCRQLAVNAEQNHRYDEASDFRFWSMELRRREGLKARRRLIVGILHSLYRYLSGYGEEIGRALAVLAGIWLLFGLLYTQVGFLNKASTTESNYKVQETISPQPPVKAFAYSLEIMTFQQPEPRPATSPGRFAVLTERIIGPIQAALLALAIRRRFMR